ncbi:MULTISPECIES: hypothetical protein [Micromonospora]|uniref:Uncharacterized protein n=1 Tax=Micromonospora yangpuensis TaxID=683228 RepID=A0A1C6VEX2_9ACTN|nr:hypothetical protein [Micromonospora yangpuensis]SCL64815.1 hypothetical protein GA0070617_5574 [Micromonospora yangpuensis]
MRLTVGPLPSAVYWRRRAVVLGAGLLLLIVLLYSCDRSDNTAGTPEGGPSPAPTESVLTPQTGGPSAGPEAPGGPGGEGDPGGAGPGGAGPGGSGSDGAGPGAAPGGSGPGGSGPGGSGSQGGSGDSGSGDSGGPGGPVAPASDGGCTDAEIVVTPVAAPTEARSGTVVDLEIKIKNLSERTCNRDVGADLQELFIKAGAERVWSSDTCGLAKGSDVQSFAPGFERAYRVAWNGRDTTRCADGLAAGPFAKAGSYQLFGRLGTKLSDPVRLTIVES